MFTNIFSLQRVFVQRFSQSELNLLYKHSATRNNIKELQIFIDSTVEKIIL